MIHLKSLQEIQIMREGGKILAATARQVAQAAKEGVALSELNQLAEKLIKAAGAQPAFLGYRPPWSNKNYPASICASINEVIVHGLPTERKLRAGDVLKIDFGVFYREFYTDTALTIIIGQSTREAEQLIRATKDALRLAINKCRPGRTLGDMGFIIGQTARKHGLSPARGLTGHGIGRKLHEEPDVRNDGQLKHGLKLEAGIVLAIEPMFCAGSPELKELPDGSFATKDGSLTAHFEHTVAVTRTGPVVLTSL